MFYRNVSRTIFGTSLSIFNHGLKVVFVVFEPGREGHRVAAVSVLKGVLAKANHVEVSLDEVDNHLLVGQLLVLCGHVIFPLKNVQMIKSN